jgi:hypothetical protein
VVDGMHKLKIDRDEKSVVWIKIREYKQHWFYNIQ